MVQISTLVTLFAMVSSIMANPVGVPDSVDLDMNNFVEDILNNPLDGDLNNLPEGDLVARQEMNNAANLGTSLARAGGRGGGGGGDMAGVIIEIAVNVGKAIWNIGNDIERRKAFTQDVARETAARFPGHTVVVCNVGYGLHGSGWQQVTGVTYEAKVGRPVTYDVVVFNAPKTFERHGDGGFQNWAYILGPGCHGNGGKVTC